MRFNTRGLFAWVGGCSGEAPGSAHGWCGYIKFPVFARTGCPVAAVAMSFRSTRKLGLQLLVALCVVNAAAVLWVVRALSEQKSSAVQMAEATTQNLARMLDQNITALSPDPVHRS